MDIGLEITIDGLKVHYICQGQGETIVLLHGWGASIPVYAAMVQLLSQQYRVIVPEFPGFGQSEQPHEPWDVDRYVQFTLHFLAHFSPKHITLMGHSFGSRVIIKLMSLPSLPFAVDRIIIMDGAGIKPKQTARKKLRTRLFKMGKAVFSAPPLRTLFPDMVERLQKKFGSADYNNATPIMRQTLVRVVNEDLTALLPRVTPDTLLIWGAQDTATPLSDGQTMERLMPHAGLAVIENAGHYSFLDQQQIFHRILCSYLKIGAPIDKEST